MTIIKKLRSVFKNQSQKKKVMLLSAILVSIALLISITSLAWFSQQRRAAKLQKVESPNSLFLNAAHREDSVNFQVKGIYPKEVVVDGNDSKILNAQGKEQYITHKDYVFNVTGDSVNKFTIQLAYTTNNPFTFKIYAAQELDTKPAVVSGQEIDYVEYPLHENSTTSGLPDLSGSEYHLDAAGPLYYKIDTSITEGTAEGGEAGEYTGEYLNANAAHDDATDSYHQKTYGDYSNVQKDAEPIYWQATNVSAFPNKSNDNKEPFSRHFILRVEWKSGALDNAGKETDIVYISVKATS